MVDLAKYESLISDLSALEAEIAILKNKYNDTIERNNELEVSLNENLQDNNVLHNRVSELEAELAQLKESAGDVISLNTEEREALKNKIKDLISRIDYHLSSD